MSDRDQDRFASGAFAPRPNRRDTRRATRLLSLIKRRGRGGHVRRVEDTPPAWAGMGHVEDMLPAWSPFAERLVIKAAPYISMLILLTMIAILASCLPSYAAGSGMPWEAPLQRILESIEGPVAKIMAVIIIIVTGLTLAFGDMGGGFRRLLQIVFGLSIAFAATSFFLSFFSFAGGALIN
mgnify:CR=1 FL=1